MKRRPSSNSKPHSAPPVPVYRQGQWQDPDLLSATEKTKSGLEAQGSREVSVDSVQLPTPPRRIRRSHSSQGFPSMRKPSDCLIRSEPVTAPEKIASPTLQFRPTVQDVHSLETPRSAARRRSIPPVRSIRQSKQFSDSTTTPTPIQPSQSTSASNPTQAVRSTKRVRFSYPDDLPNPTRQESTTSTIQNQLLARPQRTARIVQPLRSRMTQRNFSDPVTASTRVTSLDYGRKHMSTTREPSAEIQSSHIASPATRQSDGNTSTGDHVHTPLTSEIVVDDHWTSVSLSRMDDQDTESEDSLLISQEPFDPAPANPMCGPGSEDGSAERQSDRRVQLKDLGLATGFYGIDHKEPILYKVFTVEYLENGMMYVWCVSDTGKHVMQTRYLSQAEILAAYKAGFAAGLWECYDNCLYAFNTKQAYHTILGYSERDWPGLIWVPHQAGYPMVMVRQNRLGLCIVYQGDDNELVRVWHPETDVIPHGYWERSNDRIFALKDNIFYDMVYREGGAPIKVPQLLEALRHGTKKAKGDPDPKMDPWREGTLVDAPNLVETPRMEPKQAGNVQIDCGVETDPLYLEVRRPVYKDQATQTQTVLIPVSMGISQ